MIANWQITEYGTTVDTAVDEADAQRKLNLARRINPAAARAGALGIIRPDGTREITGKLHVVERASYQGRNGNPRYIVTVGDRVCYTGVDASLGYGITNWNGFNVRATVRMLRGKLTITDIVSGYREVN